ncbi:speckle-type POZ protein [Trichonephila clavata]|uniref:Speckle-type POZ protein n=1 Tax=Trichonephila clavata TaxID=2740835 RepID=A0A8X6F3S0_TRICU|nr:speckle-type POZ protein [Trichonephila clavata]
MDELLDSYLYLQQICNKESKTQYIFKWTVRDYAKISVNKNYSCHYIRIGKGLHRLRILKNESRPRDTRERKLFHLFLGITPFPSSADVTISLIGRKDQKIEAECIGRSLEQNSRRNCFFEFAESSIYLKSGIDLIILCIISVDDPHINVSVGLKKNFHADFKHLYDNELFSDLTICVGDKLFNAHRLVLAARSPVFEAMFKNEMKENNENKLDINDSDEKTFGELLRYFYIGEIGPLTSDHALNLLVLADKYDVPGLKTEIVDYLKCELSTENALSILIEAHLHNEKQLKKEAVEFIGNHMWEMMNSPRWKEFRHHLDLVDCILAYMC